MILRGRKVMRDRKAGLVFDWRGGDGSLVRLGLAAAVTGVLVAALFFTVQLDAVAVSRVSDGRTDLTVVDLEKRENRWFADLVEREALFLERWEGSDEGVRDGKIAGVSVLRPIETYSPTLREFEEVSEAVRVVGRPGLVVDALPAPAPVGIPVFSPPVPDWWLEVRAAGDGVAWQGLEVPWGEVINRGGERRVSPLSEGEYWTVVLGLDWRGGVVMCEAPQESDDSRTEFVLSFLRSRSYPGLGAEGPVRVWTLVARLFNKGVGL